MSYKKDFDIMARIALGREVAEHIKDFKDLAQLGYTEAEMYAILDYWQWLNKNGDKPIEEQMKMAIQMIGRAKFLCNTKEMTRLCLILGDTRKHRTWKKKTKESNPV